MLPLFYWSIMKLKTCSICKIQKDISEYYARKGYENGIPHCKVCERARKAKDMREYRAKNPEKMRAYDRNYRRANPDKVKNMNLKKNYGITLKDYNKMLANQNNKCSICDKEHKEDTKETRLNVDHCHVTGKVRELLCGMCNKGLGHYKDNYEWLLKAAAYVKKHKS